VFSALITLRALGLFLRQGRASFAHVYSEGGDAAAKEHA